MAVLAILPLALQLLPLLPAAVDNLLKIVNAVRRDPQTPEEAKAELDAVAARLEEVMVRVKNVKLPGDV